MNSYDIFATSHEVLDSLENRIYKKCIENQYLPQRLFDINDVHFLEKHLKEAYDAGVNSKKPE